MKVQKIKRAIAWILSVCMFFSLLMTNSIVAKADGFASLEFREATKVEDNDAVLFQLDENDWIVTVSGMESYEWNTEGSNPELRNIPEGTPLTFTLSGDALDSAESAKPRLEFAGEIMNFSEDNTITKSFDATTGPVQVQLKSESGGGEGGESGEPGPGGNPYEFGKFHIDCRDHAEGGKVLYKLDGAEEYTEVDGPIDLTDVETVTFKFEANEDMMLDTGRGVTVFDTSRSEKYHLSGESAEGKLEYVFDLADLLGDASLETTAFILEFGFQYIDGSMEERSQNMLWVYSEEYGLEHHFVDPQGDVDCLVLNGDVDIISISYNGVSYSKERLLELGSQDGERGDVWYEVDPGNMGYAEIPAGAEVTVKLLPDYGYQVLRAELNGSEIAPTQEQSVFTFTMPTNPLHLSAVFTACEDEVVTLSSDISAGDVLLAADEIDAGSALLTVETADTEKESVFDETMEELDGYEMTSCLDIGLQQVFYKGTKSDYWANEKDTLANKAEISLSLNNSIGSNDVKILHQKHDGQVEIIDADVDAGTNTVSFETDSFSTYAIIKTEAEIKRGINIGELEDENNPYLYKVVNGFLAQATEDDYSLKYDRENKTLTLKNFTYVSEDDDPTINLWDGQVELLEDKPLTLELVGTNSITSKNSQALFTSGDLTVTGSGTLTAKSEGAVISNPEGSWAPGAMFVEGQFKNYATINLESNSEFDLEAWNNFVVKEAYMPGEDDDPDRCVYQIINKGTITGMVGLGDYTGNGLVSSDTSYTRDNLHNYIGIAYYYTEDNFYPNNICGNLNDDEWRTVGKYDADGNPRASHIWYQYYYVNQYGAWLTEDFNSPQKFLLYPEDYGVAGPESLLKDKDILSVGDGQNHTVPDVDLYCLWVNKGNVTLNGNVISDLTVSAVAQRIDVDDKGYAAYERDEQGNILWLYESSPDARVTVKGDVGLLSLYDSYIGSVDIQGNISTVCKYDDINVEDYEAPAETWYASLANPGHVIDRGNFTDQVKLLDGFSGYMVYDTNDFYVLTQKGEGENATQGTCAPVDGQELVFDVSRTNGVDDITYPCIKGALTSITNKVKNALSNKTKNPVVMDIALIRDNSEKIEPTATVDISMDGIKGFSKPALYHIREDGVIEKLFAYSENGEFGGTIQCQTNSFSTYFVAENQDLLVNNINTTPGGTPGTSGGSTATVIPTPAPTPAPTVGTVVSDTNTGAKVEISDVANNEATYTAPITVDKNVTVPAVVVIGGTEYKVTKIGDNAFQGCTNLKSVTLPKDVVEIGAGAFKGCTSLTKVTLPNKVTKIGANAFNGCKKLKTITIKSTKLTDKNIDKKAFKGIKKGTVIKVPKKKVKAYTKLFQKKGLLKSVKVKA